MHLFLVRGADRAQRAPVEGVGERDQLIALAVPAMLMVGARGQADAHAVLERAQLLDPLAMVIQQFEQPFAHSLRLPSNASHLSPHTTNASTNLYRY